MISVLVPQNRIGGLDVLWQGLAHQTEKNFELILVDAIKPRRSIGTENPFRWTHVEPRDNPFPAVSFCRSMNTAIAHARGDTLLMLCDYSFLHPNCLELHAEMQKKHRGPVTFDYRYVTMPALHPDVPSYRETEPGTEENAAAYTAAVNANADRYVADLDAGKLDRFMWSVFAEPFRGVDGLAVEHEHKPSGADLANDWNYCSAKNESVPTELMLEMNGFDEAYDRSHCYQDSEWSYRLRERGIRWHAGPPGHTVSVVNPRPWSNIKRLEKPLFFNRELCFGSRRAELRLPVNPEFILRNWRRKTIGIVAADTPNLPRSILR